MKIQLNGEARTVAAGDYASLRDAIGSDANALIVGGHARPWQTPTRDGDEAIFLDATSAPDARTWRAIYDARYGRAIMEQLQAGRVAVCGLGGLGSLVAIELGRLGVGELLLVDFDAVEPTNLARQQYQLRHLGMTKTAAMAEILAECAPLTRVTTHTLRLAPDNIAATLADWPIVCEALDRPDAKAMLTAELLALDPRPTMVGASGMAGYGSGNAIGVKEALPGFYLAGDGSSEGEEGIGLMAPRVGLCASAQATMIMRLLLGETTP
ncbi:MAG: sulfur carrier protein ThiS adenylyltransferase ThiF [Peptococcaceae bacterium]|nr:sulfur carrier protein ThiS adenylyltransferase ThiF [Peptococcaceae bacterium]